jgi:hypothetical protein
MYSKRLLHWLELANIALRRKPKPITPAMIQNLPFGAREFREPPAERSVSQGEKVAFQKQIESPRKPKNR